MLKKLTGRVLLIAVFGVTAPVAGAQRIVTNGGPWVPDTRGSSSFGLITGTNPRNGNGSLQLSLPGSLSDWSWWNLFAGDPFQTAGWGLLSDVNRVGFDWYRVLLPPTGDVAWERQTPALRLYVRSGDPTAPEFAEVVWERYYNVGLPTPTDQWISEDLSSQLFWRFVTGEGYTISDCTNPSSITPGIPLKTATAPAWGSGANCFPSDAIVYGIGVGLGSNWPHPYQGFVDNVQLGFAGNTDLTVWDNFELVDSSVTPEPATLMLVGSGLAGLGARALRRRRRRA
jgi:hypothetical protein